jgi:hypothetical protein
MVAKIDLPWLIGNASECLALINGRIIPETKLVISSVNMKIDGSFAD